MTIGEIELRARTMLLDTYEGSYRYEPVEMFRALEDGVTELKKLRPEARYVDGVLDERALTDTQYAKKLEFFVPLQFPAAVDTVNYSLETYRELKINIDERWRRALVYYVIYAMYLKDDADTVNAEKASAYYQRFTAEAAT